MNNFVSADGNRSFIMCCGELEMDLLERHVTLSGKPVELRGTEFLILTYLVRNENRAVTRTMLMKRIWNYTHDGLHSVIDTHIDSLMEKLNRDSSRQLISRHGPHGFIFHAGHAQTTHD